jgi:hypothetical protein
MQSASNKPSGHLNPSIVRHRHRLVKTQRQISARRLFPGQPIGIRFIVVSSSLLSASGVRGLRPVGGLAPSSGIADGLWSSQSGFTRKSIGFAEPIDVHRSSCPESPISGRGRPPTYFSSRPSWPVPGRPNRARERISIGRTRTRSAVPSIALSRPSGRVALVAWRVSPSHRSTA